MTAFSFLALQSTNRLSNRYSHVLGWRLIQGGAYKQFVAVEWGLIRSFTVCKPGDRDNAVKPEELVGLLLVI